MATAEELRREIIRLERLLRGITDQRVQDELRKMIEELQSRLGDAEEGPSSPPRGANLAGTGNLSSSLTRCADADPLPLTPPG
jgi:hypothetical protein